MGFATGTMDAAHSEINSTRDIIPSRSNLFIEIDIGFQCVRYCSGFYVFWFCVLIYLDLRLYTF